MFFALPDNPYKTKEPIHSSIQKDGLIQQPPVIISKDFWNSINGEVRFKEVIEIFKKNF